MAMSATAVMRGDADHRRFRADQRAADAALRAAQLHRLRLSRDPPGPDRHRGDVRAARRRSPRSWTSPTRGRWSVSGGTVRFEDVDFHYDLRPADPQGRQLRGAGRQDHRHRRSVGRRQVDDLAAALPLLRRHRRARSPSTARTSATSPRNRCAPPSAWSRRTPCCSTTPSPTTSATAGPTPATRRSRRRRHGPDRRFHRAACRRATRPRSASAA